MAAIRLIAFRGTRPFADARLIGTSDAQTALNSILESGRLKPFKEASAISASGVVSGVTLYRYTNTIWFEWTSEVNAVKAMESADSYNRVIYTGDGAPKYTYNTVAGVSGPPDVAFSLGLPIPSTPTTTVLGTETPDAGIKETRFYVYTFVDALGAEGPPSAPSAENEVGSGQYVQINSLQAAPAGPYNISTIRIYRTNTGSSRTAFQYVAELPIGINSYADVLASSELGEVLVTEGFLAPSPNMQGLTAHPGGFFAGFFGNTLAFSEPGFYYAWPAKYEKVLETDIVAVAVAGATMVVATKGQPYVAIGNTPASMVLQKLEMDAACSASRSMVDMGGSVIYAGPNGLIAVADNGVNLLTAQIFTREQWQAFTPTSMHAYLWRGSYLCFYSGAGGGAFIINPKEPAAGVVFLNESIQAGFSDLNDGKLYVNQNNTLKQWYNSTFVAYTWKSKVFTLPTLTNMGAAKVIALSYPVTFTLYGDSVLRHTVAVNNSEPFRLPGGYRALDFEVEVQGTAEVQEVQVAQTMNDLRAI